MVIPVVLGVILIVFMFQAFSRDDPVDEILGAGATEEDRTALRIAMGLNDPIIIQYARYVWEFVSKGNLGTSYYSRQPVMGELLRRYPITMRLAFTSISLAALIGIPLGVISAVKQYTMVDSSILAVTVFILAMPNFWLALLLISLFAVTLRWLPAVGLANPLGWIMPTIVAMITPMGNCTRTTRSSMLESIRQDYIRTVRAKGMSEFTVVIRHALRNSLIPILAQIGNSLGIQLGGSLIVESIFGLPGIGKYAIDAISARNLPSVRGSVVLLAITFTVVNTILDLIIMMIDPRVKTALLFSGKKKKSAQVLKKEVAETDG